MQKVTVGQALVKARRAAGLSQAELAAGMGTTQSAVSRAESGAALPSFDFVDRYARALGRPITITFGRERESPRSERAERVRRALRGFVFDPWARDPSPAEARLLEADGLGREHFARAQTP